MFLCSADREGRAVSLVYSELTSSPVSVTCSSLLEGKAQARQETHHVQARHLLSVCACHSRVLYVCVCVCVCVCVPRASPSRGEGTRQIRGKPRLGVAQHLPGSTTGTGRAVAGFPGLFPSRGASHMSSHTAQGEGFTLPRATLSLQKDILKTRTLVLSTLLPNRLGLWLVATAMDRPARLCPQLLPGLDLAEAPDTISQPSGLVARTWRERPRPQASGPVP